MQQLRVKLQQLEQMMDEVKGKLNELEGQPASHHASEGGPSNSLVSAVTSVALSHGAFLWSSGWHSSTWQAGGPEEAGVREHDGHLWICHDGFGL